MKLHFGKTRYPGRFRFHHGTISHGSVPNQEVYFEHPIKWWVGISFTRSFFGFIKTEPTRDIRERAKPKH